MKSSLLIMTIFHVMVLPSLGDLEGPNVCEKDQEITVFITKQVSIPYQVKTNVLCATPPFRCKKEETRYRMESKEEPHKVNKSIKVCCEGFARSGNYCLSPSSDNLASNLIAPNMQSEIITSSSSPNIWIGISLTSLLIVAIFMLLLFRYKKKIHSLREEVNYVTYTVERGSSCGSSAHYAAPSEVTCSSVSPNVKNNNVVSVVNQLKSPDPTKISNIEKAAALKKAIELEHDHPFACSSSASSSAFASASSSSSAKIPVKSPSASSPKQLFKPSANPNLYHCPEYEKNDKEPIYEELPDTPATDDASSSSSSTSHESELYVNDLSNSSVYDRPRALNQLNISPPLRHENTALVRSPSSNEESDTERPLSSQDGAGTSASCQPPPLPLKNDQITQEHKSMSPQ